MTTTTTTNGLANAGREARVASTRKAPAGGAPSAVNGQWYEGGQFMPDTGLFCGKGKCRVALAKYEALAAEFLALGMVVTYSEKWERYEIRPIAADPAISPHHCFHGFGSLSRFLPAVIRIRKMTEESRNRRA